MVIWAPYGYLFLTVRLSKVATIVREKGYFLGLAVFLQAFGVGVRVRCAASEETCPTLAPSGNQNFNSRLMTHKVITLVAFIT